MCGIAGLIDPRLGKAAIERALQSMTDSIAHRGPDDEGFFVVDGAGIGMRRLSIIDVAGGQQPIASEDGSVQVVFNGEIYNYLELRHGLEQRGHCLSTRSDTEVIAHLYEEKAAGCLEDLRGMFGVAVWDQRRQRLLVARDRLGEKPIFYAHDGQRLLFGSEIKAILAASPELAEPDPAAVLPYFRYGFVPEPGTMFRRIRKLPAGSYLLFERGQLTIAPYWRVTFGETSDDTRNHGQWVEGLDALLEESVRIRLMSEVPLGVFLSGGLDSSTVAAYAQRASGRALKTFTIGFDRPEWDESAAAAEVARHLGTDHHTLMLRERDLSADLPGTVLTLVRHFDEPFGDSSALPTYHVSRLARQHVTVILSGDGGDELFAGYTTYQGIRFAESYRRLPDWLGSGMLPALAQTAALHLPAGRRYALQRAARVLRDSRLPFEELYLSKAALCDGDTLRALIAPDVLSAAGRGGPPYPPDVAAAMSSGLPELSKAGYADLRFRLLDDMLVKVDRMSMANSLEVRPPLLDHRLVEFVARMPPDLKLRGLQTKAILREAVQAYLPPSAMRRRKQGFSVPLREWLRTGLSEMVDDYLTGTDARLPDGMFDRCAVGRLIAEHHAGAADHSPAIWLLLNYAAWHAEYVGQGARRGAGSAGDEVLR